jgi:CheY-like chemotaxis protein
MSAADPAATILLVEDDAPTRTFLADNLTADGYQLLVADCARDGLRLLETKFPDVALVDLGLPDGSGLDIVRPRARLLRRGQPHRPRGAARRAQRARGRARSTARLRARLRRLRLQGDQVVAPSSTGRGLRVEDDHGASGGTPILSSPMAWRPASAARRPLTGAHARMDVPLGEGSAGPRSGRSRDVRAWAVAFACRCGRRHAPGRRARVSSRTSA